MDKRQLKNKKVKTVSREELMKLDKADLVEKIIQLEAHNTQLKNIISRNLSSDTKSGQEARKKQFDFTKSHFRKVLLRIFYFGWDYNGLAVQEDTNQTIEHHLFHALTKSCLIEKRETSQYHRCGRTDKGVSAFGQVISISLRSKHPPDIQNTQESIANEIQYCKILNRLLPKDIRVVAWMPIPMEKSDYSARFDCKQRQYRYYFPLGTLNLTAMREACTKMVGVKDFRNLCKMDVGNGVTQFVREITGVEVRPVDEGDLDKATSMYYLQIEGNAFLWHQIRCIMAVLLLIGQGREDPGVIDDLLDVEAHPRKPQYNMAPDFPLNLFKCSYELEESHQWAYDVGELKCVIAHLQSEWTVHNVKTTMIQDCIKELEKEYYKLSKKETEDAIANASDRDGDSISTYAKKETEDATVIVNERDGDSIATYADCLFQDIKAKVYTPLLKRQMCSSLEEKIEYYRKKRKIDNGDNSSTDVTT